MLSGYPLFRRMELMFSCSCCSLLFEQIINAQCTSVSIKLALRFVGPNESQRKYCPVKVGFLKTEVKKPSLLFSTKTSKNGADSSLFNRKPKEEPQNCPIYLKLPWIGKISLNFEKQTKTAINRCYQAVEPRIIFTRRKSLPAIHKDVLLSLQQSMVVYQNVCRCDCRYVGRTSQRLQDRINQHIPRCIRSDKRPTKNLLNRECKTTNTPTVYSDSAIGQHLLENEECAKHYNQYLNCGADASSHRDLASPNEI